MGEVCLIYPTDDGKPSGQMVGFRYKLVLMPLVM